MSETLPFIPLSKPHLNAKAFSNMQSCLESGKLAGDGSYCHAVEHKIEKLFKIKHALLTTSCTHALEMSLLLLNAKEGSEVILPSYTFTSTANAVLVAGLKPVFCEIDPTTMNMDVTDVEKKITNKTIAVIPVHYAGVACQMDRILELAKQRNLIVIEDAAQGVGAKWKDSYLGTIGHMGAYSFHETKNVVCGEGGALLTNDANFSDLAEIIREKGTNRKMFLKGQVDKYTWIAKGSSNILAEPLAAILDSQLEIMDELNSKRGVAFNIYLEQLKNLAQKEVLTLPTLPADTQTNYHLFHLILKNSEDRNQLMDYLRSKGIGAAFHYIPLHSSPQGRKLGYDENSLPVTTEYASRLLRLPLFYDLTPTDQDRIVNEIKRWAHKTYGIS